MKTHDTTGDQILRFLLRLINAVWTASLIIGALPLGIVWFIGSMWFMIWNAGRRRRRYLANAESLARIQAEAFRWNPNTGWTQ